MSVYSTISDIVTAGVGDVAGLATTLESELPVAHSEASSNTTVSVSPITGGAYETIHTVSSVAVAADELIVVMSVVSVSGTNTSDTFVLTHSLDGTRKGPAYFSSYTPSVSSTNGRQDTLPVFSVFQDQAAGSFDLELEVGALTGTTVGTFTSVAYSTHVFSFKRR